MNAKNIVDQKLIFKSVITLPKLLTMRNSLKNLKMNLPRDQL